MAMKRFSLTVLALLIAVPCHAQRAAETAPALALTNTTMQTLVRQVGSSVVQVVVTGYQPAADDSGGAALVRARSIGSGAVIAPGGFIVTNAHVVAGAERIEVVLPDGGREETPLGRPGGRSVAADLVGVAPEIDLALLKVDEDLPSLTIADPASVNQGELVLAFGSPDGLRNSVSMGLVSAVARQVQPASPIAYVQTDAAINPGNSGGPLVNMDGRLVGLNTFIRTESGGSEGLGFALPGAVVALAIPQLREYGHLHRATLGMALQNITSLMREGLNLDPDSTLIIADVVADGPASKAGLRPGDVVTALDGRDVQNFTFSELYPYLYALRDGQEVTVGVTRDGKANVAHVEAVTAPHDCERPSLVQIQNAIVEPLGIIGASMRDADHSGVVVTARLAGTSAADPHVESGDLILAVNGTPITSVVSLRDAMGRIDHGHAVVLQVERDGGLTYVSFER
jgi:serine protease Do